MNELLQYNCKNKMLCHLKDEVIFVGGAFSLDMSVFKIFRWASITGSCWGFQLFCNMENCKGITGKRS